MNDNNSVAEGHMTLLGDACLKGLGRREGTKRLLMYLVVLPQARPVWKLSSCHSM